MDRRERLKELQQAILAAVNAQFLDVWTALPAIVSDVSELAGEMVLTVQPAILIPVRDSAGAITLVKMPVCKDVPVVWQGGGGVTLTFPVQPGDEALVVFGSRCMDGWWQNGGVQPPAEFRFMDLSDGFALVGLRSLPRVLSSINSTAAELRSDDASTYVRVDPSGKVRVQAENVEALGTVSWSWNVNGYGQRVSYLGANVWEVHNYTTAGAGQTVNTVNSTINPPDIPAGP